MADECKKQDSTVTAYKIDKIVEKEFRNKKELDNDHFCDLTSQKWSSKI